MTQVASHQTTQSSTATKKFKQPSLWLLLPSIILPPVAITLYYDWRPPRRTLAISIVLTVCLWIPGIIFAIYRIYFYKNKRRRIRFFALDEEKDSDNENSIEMEPIKVYQPQPHYAVPLVAKDLEHLKNTAAAVTKEN